MKAKTTVLALIFVFALAVMTGCSKNSSVFGSERSDAQVAGDVQSKINADSTLAGRQISINANKGVVTLTGDVQSDAEVTSAVNDAQGVDGVKQVISKLNIASAAAAPAAAAPAMTEPAPAVAPAHRRPTPAHTAQARRPEPTTSSSTRVRDYSDNSTPATPSTYNAANTTPAQPAAPAPPQKLTVPSGTTLAVRTVESLSSEKNQPNDVFHGTLNSEVYVGDSIAIPSGADVEGRVVDAKNASHYAGSSLLALEITRISYNGHSYNVTTNQWSKQGAARGKNTAGKVAGGAAVGAVLGGIFGGGKGAAIGATAGAGAGAGANTITRGQQVTLPAESLLQFQLQNPISVTPATNSRNGRRPLNSDDQSE